MSLVKPVVVRKNKKNAISPSSLTAHNSEPQWVSARSLMVDTSYQRPLRKERVNMIVANFDPSAFGSIIVSQRSDGTMAIVDGQTRIAALHDLGWADQSVPALVFHGLSLSEEAGMFSILNSNRSKPKVAEIFKAEVQAGMPMAIEINEILNRLGLDVTTAPQGEGIRSIGTVQRLYALGGIDLVEKTLTVMYEAYGRDVDSYNHDLMTSLGAIIMKNGRGVDLKRLTEKLQEMGTPKSIVNRGRGAAHALGTKALVEIANIVIRSYNKALRTNRILEFEARSDMFKRGRGVRQVQD